MALSIQYHYKREVYYKKQYNQSALYIAYYRQRVSKNEVLRNIVPSTDEIYQQDFHKVIALNRATNAAPLEQHRVDNLPSTKIWQKCNV